MRITFVVAMALLLGGCAGLIPRLPTGELDVERIAEIASTAADSAVVGIGLAGDEATGGGDWLGYGIGTLLSLAVATLTGKAGHALYRSGRSA